MRKTKWFQDNPKRRERGREGEKRKGSRCNNEKIEAGQGPRESVKNGNMQIEKREKNKGKKNNQREVKETKKVLEKEMRSQRGKKENGIVEKRGRKVI